MKSGSYNSWHDPKQGPSWYSGHSPDGDREARHRYLAAGGARKPDNADSDRGEPAPDSTEPVASEQESYQSDFWSLESSTGDYEDELTTAGDDPVEDGLRDNEPEDLLDPVTQPSLPPAKGSAPVDSVAVWRAVLDELVVTLRRDEFDTWVRDSCALAYEDGQLIIGVPTSYVADWLQHRLKPRIIWLLRSMMGRTVEVKFTVRPQAVKAESDFNDMPLYQPPAADAPPAPEPSERQNKVLKEWSADRNGPLNGTPAPSGLESTVRYSTQLSAHYMFESFVVGNHNRMAHAAAEAVASAPGLRYNPLFIYGGVGLGKTHLLQAIGNRAQQNGFQVLYCSSEKFTNELIQAIRSQSTQAFRAKYRQVDILLIDDIQFIGGKESTQEEFFHTFNDLYASGRQIVLSSDRPPKALATLEERLRSRFEGGLQTDISRPDFETRVAILQSKAGRLGLRVSHDVLMLVAERVDSNVRELEGALNQLSLITDTHNPVLTYDDAAALLDTLTPNLTPCVPARVVEIVADYFDLTVDVLVGKGRPKDISAARQIAMYLLREENSLSLPAIGAVLGNRDHTTVRHGVSRVTEALRRDEEVRQHVMALRERIYQPLQS